MSVEFSVIIPLFNKEKSINRTLISILQQSYSSFEIVVVNDGSTDRSLEIVSELKDERIRIINKTNSGVSSARNVGIINSKNRYLAFIDGDDWWAKGYLQKISELIQWYPNEFFFASQYVNVYRGIKYLSANIFPEGQNRGVINPFKCGIKVGTLPLHTSAVVVDKSILSDEDLFDEKISFYEDYDFFIRMLKKSNLVYLQQGELAFYQRDGDPSNKLTGSLPKYHEHLVYYVNKYLILCDEMPGLREFIQGFRIQAAKLFYLKGGDKKIVKDIIENTDKKYLTLCNNFFFKLPRFLVTKLVNIKVRINSLTGVNKFKS